MEALAMGFFGAGLGECADGEERDGAVVRECAVRHKRFTARKMGVVRVEGTEDGAFCCRGGFRVVQGVDERREAERVREEKPIPIRLRISIWILVMAKISGQKIDSFTCLLSVAFLPCRREPLDCRHPLVAG